MRFNAPKYYSYTQKSGYAWFNVETSKNKILVPKGSIR